jgi:hypothetical protein
MQCVILTTTKPFISSHNLPCLPFLILPIPIQVLQNCPPEDIAWYDDSGSINEAVTDTNQMQLSCITADTDTDAAENFTADDQDRCPRSAAHKKKKGIHFQIK